MKILRLRLAAAATALAFSAVALAEGQGLQLEREPVAPPTDLDEVPVYVIADKIEGVGSDEVEASGDAELRKPNAYIKADRIRYFRATDEVEAEGNVRLFKDGDLVTGPRLRMRVDDAQGIFESPTFALAPRLRKRQLKPVEGRGAASAARLAGDDRYRVSDATFTTCKPGDSGWAVSAGELDIDMNRSVGTARDAQFTFLGLTTPSFPYATFSLNDERKSGFLPPVFGAQDKLGLEFALPFYWNIAPYLDATITGRYMQKRGVQALTELRYLQPWYSGIARFDYLPEDQVTGTERWAGVWRHVFNYQGRWLGNVNFNQVSDDNYYRDLSGRLVQATQLYLPREATVIYGGGGWWTATARVQDFQTLQDPQNPVPVPYARLPEITARALYPWVRGLDLGGTAQFTNFTHPTQVTGRRTWVYPYAAWPLLNPGSFLVPKVGLNFTSYVLDGVAPGQPTTQTRTLPIASVDAGLIFERDTSLGGRPVLQTLEPRAYYLYVPYRNQNNIPLFDTTTADLNFAQIFAENYYSGWDRISNANQITLAVTSRLIVPSTGQEALRGLLGQVFYFNDQQVQLNPQTPLRTGSTSPYLVGLSGIIWPGWSTEFAAQLASETFRAERLNFGIRYQPALNKVVNLGYRFTDQQIVSPSIHQINVSAQWPLGAGFYAVGRFNWDLQASQPVERLAGIEYNAGCWIVRAVAQAFPTSAGQTTTNFFLQLEFDGFSKIGANPLEALRRSIPGYTRLNQNDPNRQQFDYFD